LHSVFLSKDLQFLKNGGTAFPLVFNGLDSLEDFYVDKRKDSVGIFKILRSKGLWVYKGIAYNDNDLREYGNEKDNAYNGYGAVAI